MAYPHIPPRASRVGAEAHVVTVGTSIVRNIAQELGEPYVRWSRSLPNSPDDVEAGNKASPGTTEFKRAYEVLTQNPRKYSAELNAMWNYLAKGRVEYVLLITTDSGTCYFCAKILEHYLRQIRNIPYVEATRVQKLGIDFEEGIHNLLDILTTAIPQLRRAGYRVLLNATGGFKPETAVLYLYACLAGIDKVYYIHELMKEVIELPTVPIQLVPELGKWEQLSDKYIEMLEQRGVLVRDTKTGELTLRKWIKRLVT
ncbi:MAG: hypothetical protein DRJ40_09615 [Thermoprotei archaeon]|nr:MAG: hypothetical protein DRJ40_09615 [Thermoprotei archaeon]